MAKNKFNTPEFVEIFTEVRGNPAKHLMKKDDETGEYLVPDSEIEQLAKAIRASEFYCEPWLKGCDPATVLFEDVIRDLGSDNPRRVRDAVNKAYGAEHRVRAMGLEVYIEWRRAGMPATPKVQAQKPKPPAKKAVAKRPSKPSVSLPRLKDETAGNLRRLLTKQHLLDEMPADLRVQLKDAEKAMGKGQLLQPTAEALLLAFQQWLLLRKERRDLADRRHGLCKVILPALQQHDYLLDTFAGDERVVGHLADLREALASADGKELSRVVRAGDRLCGLLDGTIAPVVSISAPQDTTNIASPDYIRQRLGHLEAPPRGRPVAGAGKGQKEKAKRKSG